jgi:putative transposase
MTSPLPSRGMLSFTDGGAARDGTSDRAQRKNGQTPRSDLRTVPRLAVTDAPAVDVAAASDLRDWVATYARRGHVDAEIHRRLELVLYRSIERHAIEDCMVALRADARRWQTRALDPLYVAVTFEALRVKFAESHGSRNRVYHLALGFRSDGSKELLGLWLETAPVAVFWRDVLADLRKRGVADVLLYLGLPELRAEALVSYPAAEAHASIADLMRGSLTFVSSQRRSPVAGALKQVYLAADAAGADRSLEEFARSDWGRLYAAIAPLWRRHWPDVARFVSLPVDFRRVVVSTYALDALARDVKRALRVHGQFESEEAALVRLHLVVSACQDSWRRPQREWHAAKSQLAVRFPDRFLPSA